MPARPILTALAACALAAGGPAFGQSSKAKPAKAAAPVSAWTTVTYPEGSAPRGKLLYDRFCAACHAGAPPAPPGAPPGGGPPGAGPMGGGPMLPPGTAELQVKYGGEVPAELEKRTDLTAESVAYFVRHGAGVMPPIRKTELSDADLKSLADYLSRRR